MTTCSTARGSVPVPGAGLRMRRRALYGGMGGGRDGGGGRSQPADHPPGGDFRVGDLESAVARRHVRRRDRLQRLPVHQGQGVGAGRGSAGLPRSGGGGRPPPVGVGHRGGVRGAAAAVPAAGTAVLADNGVFALSEPGRLDEVLAAAGLTIQDDDEIEAVVGFSDTDTDTTPRSARSQRPARPSSPSRSPGNRPWPRRCATRSTSSPARTNRRSSRAGSGRHRPRLRWKPSRDDPRTTS